MTAAFDEDAIRNWLVDYLVTNIGCSPDEIDLDAPLSDLAVGSSDAVVLTGELSELLGRTVSPVEFWQYPTINTLAKFLTGGEVEPTVEVASGRDAGSENEPIAVIGLGCRFPAGPDAEGNIEGPEAYWDFLSAGRSAVREVPAERWETFQIDSPEAAAASAYPSFEAGSGIVSAGLEMKVDYMFDEVWGIETTVAYNQLLGDAADSPISVEDDQYSASIVLTRRFDWRF